MFCLLQQRPARMKGQAALTLVLLVGALVVPSSLASATNTTYAVVSTSPASPASPTSPTSPASTTEEAKVASNTTTKSSYTTSNRSAATSSDAEVSSILSFDTKDILIQNMRSEDEDTNNEKVCTYLFISGRSLRDGIGASASVQGS